MWGGREREGTIASLIGKSADPAATTNEVGLLMRWDRSGLKVVIPDDANDRRLDRCRGAGIRCPPDVLMAAGCRERTNDRPV